MIILTIIAVWFAVSFVFVLALCGAAARPLPVQETEIAADEGVEVYWHVHSTPVEATASRTVPA